MKIGAKTGDRLAGVVASQGARLLYRAAFGLAKRSNAAVLDFGYSITDI